MYFSISGILSSMTGNAGDLSGEDLIFVHGVRLLTGIFEHIYTINVAYFSVKRNGADRGYILYREMG